MIRNESENIKSWIQLTFYKFFMLFSGPSTLGLAILLLAHGHVVVPIHLQLLWGKIFSQIKLLSPCSSFVNIVFLLRRSKFLLQHILPVEVVHDEWAVDWGIISWNEVIIYFMSKVDIIVESWILIWFINLLLFLDNSFMFYLASGHFVRLVHWARVIPLQRG